MVQLVCIYATDFLDITVTFTQDQFPGSETTGFVIVHVELHRGTSAYPFNVTVTPSEQSPVSAEGNSIMCIIMYELKNVWLTGGVDFNTTPLTATFASGMTMSNVSVPVIVDKVAEEHEEFNLALSVSSFLGPSITAGSRDRAIGVIADSTGKPSCYNMMRKYNFLTY